MSEESTTPENLAPEAPKPAPKPTAQQATRPSLVGPALSAFKGLTWTGVIFVLIGLAFWLIMLAAAGQESSYYDDGSGTRMLGFVTFVGFAMFSAPFFVGAAVVAGLGERK